jgi:CRP-like cAMP-binding protein
LYLQLK